MQLTFGKYAGREISDPAVPTAYLAWLYEDRVALDEALKEELARREAEAEGNVTWPERIIAAGFRALAMQHHPDHGGDSDDMRAILGANAELRRLVAGLARKQPDSERQFSHSRRAG